MEIDIKEYLSEEEIKNICASEVREIIRQNILHYQNDIKNCIASLSYKVIEKDIDEKIPDYKEQIVAGIERCLEEKYQMFHVFRKPDTYDRVGNVGYEIVKSQIMKREQDIRDRVNKEIDEYDPKELITNMFARKWEEAMERFQDIADIMFYMFKKNE